MVKGKKRAAAKGDKGNTTRGKTRRDWKSRFLTTLRKSANVSASCKAAHISRKAAYAARSTDSKVGDSLRAAEEFANEWDEVIEAAVDDLEEEARRRAFHGLVRKKFTRTGGPIIDPATKRQYFEYEYSDTLMQTLLRAHRPQKYAERSRTENVNLDVSTLNDQQLALLAGGAPLAVVLAAASAGGNGTPTAPAASDKGEPTVPAS